MMQKVAHVSNATGTTEGIFAEYVQTARREREHIPGDM